ncbi:hypothetical protein [Pandoraea vervacti]|uniref:hypothetical protein n=1 Tax=Pandoraea vervacti TaxID=656178 RepID=UPI001F287E80|nr:hypothetical protein [Pandoraea vervacti]
MKLPLVTRITVATFEADACDADAALAEYAERFGLAAMALTSDEWMPPTIAPV